MHLTFRQLQIFDAVARHLSFSRASQELHLTQPAVSMQIRQLEDSIGMPVVEHLGKKIYLTQAGETLCQHARAIFRELRETREALESLREGMCGRLDIAIVSTAKYFAPLLLSRFCELHPQVQLKLTVNNRETILQKLVANEVDMVIMGQSPEGMDLVSKPFAENSLLIVANPSHPLCGVQNLTLETVAQEQFLLREKGSGTRQSLERLMDSKKLPIKARMEMSSDETIKQAAMAGMGLAFLSKYAIRLELAAGKLVALPVPGTPIQRKWYLTHHRDKKLSPVGAAFKQFLLEQAPSMLAEQEAQS